MRKTKKEQPKIEERPRNKCACCGKRRYRDRMVKMFVHPILALHEFWVCAPWGWRRKGCVEQFRTDVMLYHNTGAFQITFNPKLVNPGE